MNTITQYLESIFLAVPKTDATEQLKTDVAANMEDRFEELLAEGKSENEAVGTVIAEFGSLDELLEGLDLQATARANEDQANEDVNVRNQFISGDVLSLTEAANFLVSYRKTATQIAFGVFFILFGLSAVVFTGMSPIFPAGFGVAFLFLTIAVGVGLFIVAGIKINQLLTFIQNRPILGETRAMLRAEKAKFQKSFSTCIILGVAFCILSPAPSIMTGGSSYAVSLLFTFIGAGVFLFIYGGMIYAAYNFPGQTTEQW
jgi:hypothetical protein